MILGIKEDFSSNITLDTQLKAVPDSGLYLNSGVHPSITVENLLEFLPKLDFTIAAWDSGTSYTVYSTSHNKSDLVTHNSVVYQSIQAGTNKEPGVETEYWLATNEESLKLKAFIEKVKDKVYADLNLTKRIVENQYLYHNGSQTHTLSNDYAAWVIEPRGSDYVSFRINEIALQKSGTTPVNVYIINQDELINTITVTPDNGRLTFEDKTQVLSGKGKHLIAIDSTEVITDYASVDPLKFEGFVAYTATGTGEAPESATYSYSTSGIGLGLNLTAYFDGAKYIDNNLSEFGNFIRATFELMAFQMFQANPHNVSNRAQRIRMSDEFLLGELKNMQMDSVISRYYRELKKAKSRIEKSSDTQLTDNNDGLTISVGSI